MKFLQKTTKSIKFQFKNLVFTLDYSYDWDGLTRYPESILTRENSAKAFFLTGSIIDSFEVKDDVLSIQRYWEIVPQGKISLGFSLDYTGPQVSRFFIPPVIQDSSQVQRDFAFLTQRLSFPGGLFAYTIDESFFIQLLPSQLTHQGTSLGLAAHSFSDCNSFRLKYRFPALEIISPELISQGYQPFNSTQYYESPGNFKVTQEMMIRYDAQKKLFPFAVNNNLQKAPTNTITTDWFDKQINHLFENYYYEKNAVAGILKHKKSSEISVFSSLLSAQTIAKQYPNNSELIEKALRMAEFALKGQNPSGFFYPYFHLKKGWRLTEQANREPKSFCFLDSCKIALHLINLSAELKKHNMSHNRFLTSGQWFIQQFFNSRQKLKALGTVISIPGWECLEKSEDILFLLKPLAALWKITENVVYKQAFEHLAEREFPLTSENAGNMRTQLFTCDLLNVIEEMNIKTDNIDNYAQNLLPWFYTQASSSGLGKNPYLSQIDSSEKLIAYFNFAYSAYVLDNIAPRLSNELKNSIANLAENLKHLRATSNMETHGMIYTHWTPNPKNIEQTIGQVIEASSEEFCQELYYAVHLQNQ